MDKLTMAHEWAMKYGRDLMYKTVENAWKYADAMQAEADKRNKAEAAQKRKEMREMLNAPNTFVEREDQHFDDVSSDEIRANFHYCENGVCVHCGKSEKTIDDEMWRRVEGARAINQEEWHPDWSQAPTGYNWWAIDEDGRANWFMNKPVLDDTEWNTIGMDVKYTRCGTFNYQGDWKDSLRERPNGN